MILPSYSYLYTSLYTLLSKNASSMLLLYLYQTLKSAVHVRGQLSKDCRIILSLHALVLRYLTVLGNILMDHERSN